MVGWRIASERGRRIVACWVIQPCVRGWIARRRLKASRREWIQRLRRMGVTERGLREWGLADEAGPYLSDVDLEPDFSGYGYEPW